MYYLISFLIQLTDIYRVKLNMANTTNRRYVIYNGPGYIFDVLNKKKQGLYLHSLNTPMPLAVLYTFFNSN